MRARVDQVDDALARRHFTLGVLLLDFPRDRRPF
jgi:hypothetical protein